MSLILILPGATSRTRQELRWFNTQAGNRYLPKRYGGDVVLFRTTENTEIYYGWEELVGGKTKTYTVPGTHTSLIEGQSAFYVASKLRELMDKHLSTSGLPANT